jgi:hypothetical protein
MKTFTKIPSTKPTFTYAALLIGLACIAEPGTADILWTGTGADANALFADDNYDFSGSSVTEINVAPSGSTGNLILDDVTYTGATIVASDFSGFGRYNLGDNYTVTLDASSITTNSSGGFAGDATTADPSNYLLKNGSFISAQFVSTNTAFVLQDTSILSLRGAGGAISGTDNTFTLVGTDAGFNFTSKTAAEAVSQYGSYVIVDGAAAVFGADPLVAEAGDTAIVIENAGSGADNVTIKSLVVPEPSSLALLGLGGLLVARRRRG